MGKNSGAVKAIYSTHILDEIKLWANACASSEQGDQEFSKIQKTILEGHIPGFSFDYLTTSTIICDRHMLPMATDVLCLGVSDALATGYVDVAEHDDMSPVSYLNTGKIINSADLRPYEEWLEHPFYLLHCEKFGIAKTLTLSFRNPERFMTFLSFEYISTNQDQSWDKFKHSQLELATFPFALAWFYRKGFMDEAALERRIFAMQSLTESQLTHIRKYVNSPALDFQSQAKELNISANWLKESLYNIRDMVSGKLGWENGANRSSQSSLRQLEREFHFFAMLGDPTRTVFTPHLPAIS